MRDLEVAMILLAILLPPVAVLICGKPFQALVNCLLTLCFWIPGMIHAILVVNARNADRRQQALLLAQANAALAQRRAIEDQTAALMAAQQVVTVDGETV
jgi:uncharacterized membrane protein YqaE (UPF0057 family)